MTSPASPAVSRHWLGPFGSRPRLRKAILIGLAAGVVMALIPGGLDRATRVIVAWDTGCLSYVALILRQITARDAPYIRGVAAKQDEGQGIILGLVTVLAVASLAAVAVELSTAKDAGGIVEALRIGLAMGTVALSWFVTQLIFALHYAHEYYAPDDDDDPETKELGGLKFPGKEPPDYWDFVHFAIVIGVASQTADIAFESKRMRRIGTVHSLISFTFNTVVLALTINALAGLL